MVSMLTWTLRRTLLWIFMLLSSTYYPVFCNIMARDESVAAKTDEVENSPLSHQEYLQEVKEAPISGFDFYSKEDYGENWWDDDLRHNNDDKLHNFLRVQDKKINAAVNVKLGDSSNFINSGHVGSNMIYDTADNRSPGVYFPQKQWRTMNSAANLDLGPASTFGNRGKIGSNIEVIRKPTLLRSDSLYYPEIPSSYPSNLQLENLNAATNLKAGYEAKLVNEGDIGSNLLYIVALHPNTNKIHSGLHFPQKQLRTMNSAANLDLGPGSMFGNRGKIGSNVEVIRNPTISKSNGQYYPEISLSKPPSVRSENLNAATNLNAGYGSKIFNEGEIGSNLFYNIARRTTNIPRIYSETYLPHLLKRTLNSETNLNIGRQSVFGNKGNIGLNIFQNREVGKLKVKSHYPEMTFRHPQSLLSQNMNAATNLNIAYGGKLANEGEIGSNILHIVARSKHVNNVQPEIPLSRQQWRIMNSEANLDLGSLSTFGNKGKISSNIQVRMKPAVLRSQKIHYPEILWNHRPRLRSENLNAGANLKAGYGAKFINEGEIASNALHIGVRTKNMDKERPKLYFPQPQWRTMNSAANLDLGPMSIFGNRGKVGSNIEVVRKPAILRSENLYYPDLLLSNPSSLRSENMNAAMNLNTDYGSRFVNEGEIASNLIYNAARAINANKIRSGLHFPQKQWRTMNSAANLDLGPMSTFGNKGKIGSNIEVLRNPAILRSQNPYYPDWPLSYRSSLRSEDMNAAANLNTGQGSRFVNEGDIGSNLIYNAARAINANKVRSGLQFPQQQWRTMNSAANLDLGPSSTFGNKGKIGSNIEVLRKPVILRYDNLYYPDLHLSYPSSLRSADMNAAVNLNTGDGSRFINEGDIGSNLIHNAARAINGNKIRSELHFPQKQWRTMNSAANLDLGPMSTFGNKGKIGSNIEVLRNPVILRSENLYYPDLLLSYPSSLRSADMNAAANLNTGQGSRFVNEGDIGSNLIYNAARAIHANKIRSGLHYPQQQWRTMNSAANLDLSPSSTFGNRGKIGSNIEEIRNPVILKSENLYYPDLLLSYPSSLRSENMNAAANLNSDYGSRFVNEGDIGSNLIYNLAEVINDNGVWRNTGANPAQRFVSNSNQPSSRSLYMSQSSTSNPYAYAMWALRTAENDANKKSSKGKGIVNIFMESGSLFDNQGAIGNEKYEMRSSPSEINLRSPVTSYAYVIPPSGKGRSALSGGRVVTGIITKTFIQQPKLESNNNYNRNLKHTFNERSSLINDGTISAAEMLLSRGSEIASNGSKTQISNSSPAAVSFGKLGLDMAHSSNKASIVAGDNAQIFINGKMGTYQVSIPIGSIVASEGSGVSLRTFNPYWSDLFSETLELLLKSPLNFFTNFNSVITGVVKVISMDSNSRERVDVCELENPITAVEIGQPLPSNQLLLQLLFITKLRINLANLLSYMTAISATKFDESLYVALQILYNAVQYRQINVLPLLLVNTNVNLPPRLHFRAMLELLKSVAPLNVRYAINTLIEDVEKEQDRYRGISENLIPILTDTLDLDIIPNIVADIQRNVILGELDDFVNQIVEKAFSLITYENTVKDLKDILYLTMLNLPLSYSVPQLPIKLRLVAQMLYMELNNEAWICAAMRAQYIPSTNVYTDLKNFFRLLLECPGVPANIRAIVRDTVQILPDAMPSNDIHELNITSSGPTAAKVIIGDIENDALDTPIEVTNSLGNIIVK